MYPYRRRYTHTYDVDIHTHSFIGTDTHIKNTHKEKNLSVYFLRKHLRYPNMKWKTVRNSLIVLILFFVENYLQHLFSESFCFNFCLKSLRPRCMVFFSYSENVGDNYVLMETNFIFVNICLSCVIRKTGSVSLNWREPHKFFCLALFFRRKQKYQTCSLNKATFEHEIKNV